MGRRWRWRVAPPLALACTWLVLAGPAPASGAAVAGAHVSMKDFAYAPMTIHVPAGSTVTWTYDESASDPQPNCEAPYFHLVPNVSCPGHSVTSQALVNGKPLFDSGVHRAPGFPYTVRFSAPGTYPYYCVVHGGPHPNNPVTHMNGVVIVDAASVTGSTGGSQTVVSATLTPNGSVVSGSAAVQSTASQGRTRAATLAATGPGGTRAWRVAASVLAALGLALAVVRRRAAG